MQTAFAEKVGAEFGLERGKEGSNNKHLAEQEFKIKKAEEKLENLNEQIGEANGKQFIAEIKAMESERDVNIAKEQKEALQGEIKALEAELHELKTKKTELESSVPALIQQIDGAKEELEVLNTAIKKKNDEGEREFSWGGWQKATEETRRIRELEKKASLLDQFLEFPGVRVLWEQFQRMLVGMKELTRFKIKASKEKDDELDR